LEEVELVEGDYVRVPMDELINLVAGLLTRAGLSPADAGVTADVLVRADSRGIESHGVSRLRSYYLDAVREGTINPRPSIRLARNSGAVAVVEGDNGLGPVVAHRSMRLCLEMAAELGLGLVLTRGSNHFGIAAYYALMAAAEDKVGLTLTNSQPLVIPTHGRQRLVGTNPICLAVPTRGCFPFVLDMATSVVPIGRVQYHAQVGRKVPPGWGVDAEGLPTTDPRRILEGGGLLPLGGQAETAGYKGYGLALAVDLIAGVLSRAAFLDGVRSPGHAEPSDVGHAFFALRLDLLGDPDELKDRVDEFILRLKACPPGAGGEAVLVPGEKEYREEEIARDRGVRVRREVLAGLQQEGQNRGHHRRGLKRAGQ
jgi:LDH2 family malate/lactate/ureidoglycolate dehydrogenase